ncbi:MAG: hypothetical protein IPI58_04295 [Alphaproteobacteria bacterium]|nr:MAG: hypothetical protein IPI58_04295 [Alphaproteobacteria bacterium]
MTKSIKNKNGPRCRDTQKETPMGILANDYLLTCASALDTLIGDRKNDKPCWGFFIAYLTSKKALSIYEKREPPVHKLSHAVDCLELGDGVRHMFTLTMANFRHHADLIDDRDDLGQMQLWKDDIHGFNQAMSIQRRKVSGILDPLLQKASAAEVTCPFAGRAEEVVRVFLSVCAAHPDLSYVHSIIRDHAQDRIVDQKGGRHGRIDDLDVASQWPVAAVKLAQRCLIRPDEMPFDWRCKLTVNRPTP